VSTVSVLLEFDVSEPEAFGAFAAASASESEAVAQADRLLDPVAGLGIELEDETTPIPMFTEAREPVPVQALAALASTETSPDIPSRSVVVAARVEEDRLEELLQRQHVIVWSNSELSLVSEWGLGQNGEDLVEAASPATATGGGGPGSVDCRPFRPGSTIDEIRSLLDVERIWAEGFTGQGLAIGILDEGIDGGVYPVTDGFALSGSPEPGTAAVTSHGSMCAADVLIAAPDARLYDYPFLGRPLSGGLAEMLQAVLTHRALDGTPHLTNNSYGFTRVPERSLFPKHEIWDRDHPHNRKVREVVASGAPAFYSAGNCGANCPSSNCHASGIGPGHSIHAANSLAEVITVAAVNSRHERIGYSSQGPGMFESEKPDIAAYSHIFANFGPGRPGGTAQPFDNGTSAASPVACGVGALLLSALRETTPAQLSEALARGAVSPNGGGWNPELGRGIVNAGGAYDALQGLV
jgi:subtilisin family serine protease